MSFFEAIICATCNRQLSSNYTEEGKVYNSLLVFIYVNIPSFPEKYYTCSDDRSSLVTGPATDWQKSVAAVHTLGENILLLVRNNVAAVSKNQLARLDCWMTFW